MELCIYVTVVYIDSLMGPLTTGAGTIFDSFTSFLDPIHTGSSCPALIYEICLALLQPDMPCIANVHGRPALS